MMPQHSYTLKCPDNPRSCVVFSSPHSGADYPTDLLTSTRLDHLAIRSSEDAFVDELFASAPEHGAPLLTAKAPRAYVDLNRAASEMDPAIVEGAVVRGLNPCIAAGLGVIPRVVGNGQAIRSGKISAQAAQRRLDGFYHPYHTRLAGLLIEQRENYGMSILIDCHSMPRAALKNAPMVGGKRPDVILGDRYGVSCDRWISDKVQCVLEGAGLVVARNMPFAGGYITRHYGRPARQIHALQIEIDRSLYMNESEVSKHAEFDTVQGILVDVVRQIALIGPARFELAAE